VRKSVT